MLSSLTILTPLGRGFKLWSGVGLEAVGARSFFDVCVSVLAAFRSVLLQLSIQGAQQAMEAVNAINAATIFVPTVVSFCDFVLLIFFRLCLGTKPQWGQKSAVVETSPLHSGHWTMAIKLYHSIGGSNYDLFGQTLQNIKICDQKCSPPCGGMPHNNLQEFIRWNCSQLATKSATWRSL